MTDQSLPQTEVNELRKQVEDITRQLETVTKDRDTYRSLYEIEQKEATFYKRFAKVLGNEDAKYIIDHYTFFEK